jgi:hypothetical protein
MRPLHALRYLVVFGVLVAQLPHPTMFIANGLPRPDRVLPPLPRHIRAFSRNRRFYTNAAAPQFLNKFNNSEMLHGDAVHWRIVSMFIFSTGQALCQLCLIDLLRHREPIELCGGHGGVRAHIRYAKNIANL